MMGEFGKPLPQLGSPEVIAPPYRLPEKPCEVDPVTYEILRHRLWYVVLTMGETLKKVSGTATSVEANDLSTYLALADGAPVFLGPYVLLHSGIADLVVSNTLRLNRDDPGIFPGDMFFCNDPWLGPAHQCDCSIAAPFFAGEEILCWTGATLHQLDLGGVDPGGLCPNARDAFAEPSMYPCVKIVERGRLRSDLDRQIRRNSRMPEIVALDIRSMIAANNFAHGELGRLVERYGRQTVLATMIQAIEVSARKFRQRLERLPRGRFRGRDFCEIGGAAPELQEDVYEVQVTVTNTGEKLTIDFTGTSAQSGGFANCGIGGLKSGALAGLLEMLAAGIDWNAGVLAHLEIVGQLGTINNPRFPAAVSDGITEGAVVTASAVSAAVGNMLLGSAEDRATVSFNGANTFLGNTLAGIDENGRVWGTLLMDGIGLCYSGNEYRDGLDLAGAGGIPYTQFANVETNELHYPILYLFRRVGKGSGGAGYRRGGNSIELAFTPYRTPYMLMLLWTHGAEFPNAGGIAGGCPASAARFGLSTTAKIDERFARGEMPDSWESLEWTRLAAKSESHLAPGNAVYFGAPGSGGFGDPLLREPERVLADVQAGAYSADFAARFYGVVVTDGGRRLDLARTEERRRHLLAERKADSRPLAVGQHPSAQGRLDLLFHVGCALSVVRDEGGEIYWACRRCGHLYCQVSENPRTAGLFSCASICQAGHPLGQMTWCEHPRFVFRRFFCPACLVMYENEVAREEDPIVHGIEYSLEWLSSLGERAP